MSSLNYLLKLDKPECVCCKNLWLEQFLESPTPWVIESVITQEELLKGMETYLKKFGYTSDIVDNLKHRKEVIRRIFEWSAYDRLIYLPEDWLYDFKHGYPTVVDQFNPTCDRTKLVEVFCTYDIETPE